jgi:hypothetical protein
MSGSVSASNRSDAIFTHDHGLQSVVDELLSLFSRVVQ